MATILPLAPTFRRYLTPAARRRAEVDNHAPSTQQAIFLVQFDQLVRGARTITFLFRALHIRGR